MFEQIDAEKYTNVTSKLRKFFLDNDYLEVHVQDRLSILAACEDPTTVATFNYHGEIWPLPQTGQMQLENELLRRPNLKGVFTLTTSYREEPNPKPGRHCTIFPMFEFESHGTLDDLRNMEVDLIKYLNLSENPISVKYEDAKILTSAHEISSVQEKEICEHFNNIVLLEDFPEYTHPFWNMKRHDNKTHAKKIDVLIGGMETIGSAERETDKDLMRQRFETISDGEYCKLLYRKFTKERVLKELDEFLSFDFFPRFGGGIGLTRLIKAL